MRLSPVMWMWWNECVYTVQWGQKEQGEEGAGACAAGAGGSRSRTKDGVVQAGGVVLSGE